jgi:hypothetical protein
MRWRWNAWGALVLFLLAGAPAVRADLLSGFDTLATLPPSDNGSAGPVPIGFKVNFFGRLHDHLFVNTNGHVTFGAPLESPAPFNLTTTSWQIIAPFFADVDTRTGNLVQYGERRVNGRSAFSVYWPDVGYHAQHTDKLNAFALTLVERSDTGPGNFDIEFQYKRMQWDSGDSAGGDGGVGGTGARVGYSNGTGLAGTYFEMPGSGTSGTFLDGSPDSLTSHSLNSNIPGRYVFQVRNVQQVPEPGCLALAGVGAGGVLAYAWKRRRRTAW